jgi:starvation-inducible outer membrane lipoprotein
MKNILSLLVFFFLSANLFAQKETFDIIAYTPPAGWKKDVTGNIISYINTNTKNGSWCRIAIIKSTTSKGSMDADFESEWQDLVVKNYNPTEAPTLNEVQETDGWKTKEGAVKFRFNNADAMAMLTTISGFDRCASIVITTNSQEYLKDIDTFLTSVEFKKMEISTIQTPVVNDDKNSIIGTWGKNASVNPSYFDAYATSIAGYSKDQYTFNSNGTYYFVSKTFGMSFDKLLLAKENGTYQISGNNITISPQKSVLEAWSKKDSFDNLGRPAGGDDWGKLLSSQNRTLEKVTYQFTKHYFSGIQIWNLILQSNTATQRDGPFSTNTTFNNAWYYSPISFNNPVIELPYGQKMTTDEVKTEQVQQTASTNNSTLLGTWCISASDQSNYRVMNGAVSTIFRQYTFNANGTYNCNIKTFDPLLNSILLGRESGIYQITGTNLTIDPQKSVLEEWSKINGADQWGQLLKTQNINLEKVTYSFTKIYVPESGEWQLILKAGNQTNRDGPFNNYEGNAWIYIITSPAHPVIKLPGE